MTFYKFGSPNTMFDFEYCTQSNNCAFQSSGMLSACADNSSFSSSALVIELSIITSLVVVLALSILSLILLVIILA